MSRALLGFPRGAAVPPSGAATQWRVVVTSSDNPYQGAISMAKLELRSSEGGSDLTGGAGSAISSGYAELGTQAPNAFDDNTSSIWSHSAANNSGKFPWIGWSFDAPVEIVEIAVTTRNDSGSNQAPRTALVQSRTGSDPWATRWHVPFVATDWSAGQTRVFRRSGDTAPATTILDPHRYWRLYPLASRASGNLTISAWEMYETIGGANVATGQSYSASTEQSGFPVTNMFNGATNNGWATGAQWDVHATIDFGAGDERVLAEVGFRGHSSYWTLALRTGSIWFSDDGSGWKFAGGIIDFPGGSALTRTPLTGNYTL